MTFIIDGTNGETFPDSTTQSTAGLTSSSSQVAKAWVNFTNSTGTTIVINASYNVSSVTASATSDYTINFTNALSDAKYAVAGMAGSGSLNGAFLVNPVNQTANTSSAFRIKSLYQDNGLAGTTPQTVSVLVFR